MNVNMSPAVLMFMTVVVAAGMSFALGRGLALLIGNRIAYLVALVVGPTSGVVLAIALGGLAEIATVQPVVGSEHGFAFRALGTSINISILFALWGVYAQRKRVSRRK